ncbi:MAG: hypothetical protein E7378_03960 [Clostridiales bacterium]|nr:hypothetical protein [Clostridiales bacterium]
MSTTQTNNNSKNRVNKWLVVALCIVSALLLLTSILWLTSKNKNAQMGNTIENVYQRNFYDLVDNVNNAEVKLSKVLASSYDSYSRKMLDEINKNCNMASYNLSNLPISLNGIDETKKFINQVGGYTNSLCNKLDRGQSLTSAEKDTLQDIYLSMQTLKDNLANFNDQFVGQGFNIFENGNLLEGDYNNFTQKLQGVKSNDVEYPTMIYDGPFADNLYNKEIKGLPQNLVAVDFAKGEIKKAYQSVKDEDIKFKSETKSRFETFDFEVDLNQNIKLYIQVTKNGGKLLTISGYGDSSAKTISLGDAIAKAKNLAKSQTGVTFECVWSDVVGGDAYINLAPVQDKIVLYPDLIKAKVDLNSGEIVGYSASSFYTNHTQRNLQSATYDKASADAKIPQGYNVEMSRLCLAPIDYVKDTLCYEYKCIKDDSTYYIYINATNGQTENILKVIETNDGSKLM